jgi:hypothetical protein
MSMSKIEILILVSAVLLTISGVAGVIGDATGARDWIALAVGAACTAIILIAWLRARRRAG